MTSTSTAAFDRILQGAEPSDAQAKFEQSLSNISFNMAVERLAAALKLGTHSYEVGLATSDKSPKWTVIINSQTLPSNLSDVSSPIPKGWTRAASNAMTQWEYRDPDTAFIVHVAIVPRDALLLQSIVGSCMHTDDVDITQGLVLRTRSNNTNAGVTRKWTITVGHSFTKGAANKVYFCQEPCRGCRLGKCMSWCLGAKTLVSQQNLIRVSNQIDFAAYATDINTPITPLRVRDVVGVITQLFADYSLDFLQAVQQFDTLQGVDDVMSVIELQDLLHNAQGVGPYVFKKGAFSNWSFGRITYVAHSAIAITTLGSLPVTRSGDCGAIWFVLARASNGQGYVARPIGYHEAMLTDGTVGKGVVMYAIPYSTAFQHFIISTATETGLRYYIPGDSYVF